MSNRTGAPARRSQPLRRQAPPEQYTAHDCDPGAKEEDYSTSIDNRLAAAKYSSALRDIAANILRTACGAGKPNDIPRQIQELFEALMGYYECIGALPPGDALSDMLSIEVDQERIPHLSPEQLDRLEAEHLIIRGALQVAASRLVEQMTHETRGREKIADGILALERLRTEERKQRGGQAMT